MSAPAPRRIKVSAPARAICGRGELALELVALSSTSALLHHADPVGKVGETLELFLPSLSGGEIAVLAGIEQSLKIKEGHVVAVQFMVEDPSTQRALDKLLGLLLAGDGGGRRAHPRVIYNIPIRYGEQGQHAGELAEISVGGLGMRVKERIVPGSQLKVTIPDRNGHAFLSFRGSVSNERQAPEDPSTFEIGVVFNAMTPELKTSLHTLLGDLLRR